MRYSVPDLPSLPHVSLIIRNSLFAEKVTRFDRFKRRSLLFEMSSGNFALTSKLSAELTTRVPWLDGSTSALSASHPPGHLVCQWRTCRVRHINLTIYVTAKEIRSNFSFFGNLT